MRSPQGRSAFRNSSGIMMGMATEAPASSRVMLPPQRVTAVPSPLLFVLGWLVPGAGHLVLKAWIRAALIFISVVSMFAIGIALQGKIYSPNTGELLDILNFVGDLGTGVLYIVARVFDLGAPTIVLATADYGTKFIVVAGLLNLVSAVDAHSLGTGRKPL